MEREDYPNKLEIIAAIFGQRMRLYSLIEDIFRVYNRSAVDAHFGMTLGIRDALAANFEVKIIKTRSDFVVGGIQAFPNTTEYDMKRYEELLRIFFIDIDSDVYQHWTALIINNDGHRQELVS